MPKLVYPARTVSNKTPKVEVEEVVVPQPTGRPTQTVTRTVQPVVVPVAPVVTPVQEDEEITMEVE